MAAGMNILVVEDEFMTRRLLKRKLTELGHTVIGETGTMDQAIELLEKHPVDLAILDINLGGDRDGIWLGEYIRVNCRIPFIYLTAYETTDIVDRAICTQPEAYLTKPFNDVALRTTLAIVVRKWEEQEPQQTDHLLVKDGDFAKRLALQDITFIESEGNYLVVWAGKEGYRYRSTIKKILEILPGQDFIQTHRAFVVNRNRVTGINANGVQVADRALPISKGKRGSVADALKAFFGG